MTFSAIAIDPNYEDLTIAAFSYRRDNVYPSLNGERLRLTSLVNSQADSSPVAAAAIQPGVAYITGVGHGDYDTFNGYFNHPVFSVADLDPAVVAQKVMVPSGLIRAVRLRRPTVVTVGQVPATPLFVPETL